MLEMIRKSLAWLYKLSVIFFQQTQAKVGIEKKSLN